MASVLAIDLGGSSGRAVLGSLTEIGQLELKEVNRFGDYLINNDEEITWDIPKIMTEIHKSIALAQELDPEFVSIGVDTWGVDFGLIQQGELVSNPRAYRDPYTKGKVTEVNQIIGRDELYELTGIQSLEMNSLFQLVAYQELGLLKEDQTMLLIPDLINYLLTGVMKAEMTIASTTQLLDVKKCTWSQEVIDKLKLPAEIFPELVKAGTVIGELNSQRLKSDDVGPKKVIAVGSHDTASAVFSIPSLADAFFLSSGTWSLLGVQTAEPYINEASKKYQVSHEQGVDDTYLLLKNITGLWLIEEAKRDFQKKNLSFNYSEMAELSLGTTSSNFYFDTDLGELALPGELIEKLNTYGEKTNQGSLTSPGAIFRTIYENLALKYRQAFEQLSVTIGENRKEVYIVGGGSQAAILCQFTANALNKVVYAGMSEGTAVGNILNQLITLKAITIEEKQQLVASSFEFKTYFPQEVVAWEAKYQEYKKKVEAV